MGGNSRLMSDAWVWGVKETVGCRKEGWYIYPSSETT